MKRVEVDGRVVAVLEKRSINAHREGYFIVQVCTYVLYGAVDGCWQYLLTRCERLQVPVSLVDIHTY